MKLALISAVFFQLFLSACSVTGESKGSGDVEYQNIVDRVSAQHEYLTRFLGLENKFSADDENNIAELYRRFPKGTSAKAIESALQKNRIQNDDIPVEFENRPNGSRVTVRFVTNETTRRETKYTFTFITDDHGKLVETHYLTEHFNGG